MLTARRLAPGTWHSELEALARGDTTMLTPDETHEIKEELAHNAHPRGACIEALKIVQRQRGWVSNEALADVAAFLGMTTAELDNVATFYNLVFRRPVGRHVIFVCDSVSCWIRGYEGVYERLRRELGIDFGETTGDGRFTLLPLVCIGLCDHAPAMIVDEMTHGDVDPENIPEILARYP